MDSEEARYAALRQFGNVECIQERARPAGNEGRSGDCAARGMGVPATGRHANRGGARANVTY